MLSFCNPILVVLDQIKARSMKGTRVRFLERFKSLQPFHSSKGHITIYDHTQSPERFPFQTLPNPPSYKEHEHRTREEEFDRRPQASRKERIEANNKLPIKDMIGYDHSDSLTDTEDIFEDCDEEAFYDEELQMDSPQPALVKEINGDCEGLRSFEHKCPPGGSNSVILYTTSLRGIRKTFEDCHSIKFLLDSFQVVYHERDVSMHLEFREELWEILGGRIIPPMLFIKGRLIGGADEVVTLHECGKLKSLLEGIPLVTCSQKCSRCSNLRFVVCCSCNGSRKVFHGEGKDGSFSRCLKCNENGLIKCSNCS